MGIIGVRCARYFSEQGSWVGVAHQHVHGVMLFQGLDGYIGKLYLQGVDHGQLSDGCKFINVGH